MSGSDGIRWRKMSPDLTDSYPVGSPLSAGTLLLIYVEIYRSEGEPLPALVDAVARPRAVFRRTTENTPSIVVADLYESGAPRTGSSVMRADEGGGVYVSVEMTPLEDHVECVFTRVMESLGPKSARYEIPISRTRPHYGGSRAWLHCSLPSCRRRVGRLFLDPPYLVCRQCAGVVYPSQVSPQPRHVKQVERAKAIRRELGGRGVLSDPIPPRPKGMHRTTYDRLCAELKAIQAAEDERVMS